MAEKIDVQIESGQAASTLDALINKATQLEAILTRLARTLGTGAMGDSGFTAGLQELSAVRGSITALQATNPASQQVLQQTVQAGASLGVRAFSNAPQNLGAAAMIQVANQSGQQITYTPAFNAQAFAASVVQSPAQQAIQSFQNWQANLVTSQSRQQMLNSMFPAINAQPYSMGALNPNMFQNSTAFSLASKEFTRNDIQMGRMAMMGVGMNSIQQGLDISTQMRLNGGINPMGAAQAWGSLIGGGLGFLAGSLLAPGAGSIAGAGMGAMLGSSVAGWLTAPYQDKLNSLQAQMPLESSYYGGGFMTGNPRATARNIRFAELVASDMNRKALPEWMQFNINQAGQTWASLASGMVAGGMNPWAKSDSGQVYGVPQEGYDKMAEYMRQGIRGGGDKGHLLGSQADLARMAILSLGYGREEVGEAHMRRLLRLYGNTAQEIAKTIAPIYGTLPETGGNLADITKQYGPQLTSTYLRIQTESLKPEVSLEELMKFRAATGTAERAAQLGSLQVRGSGAASYKAYQDMMEGISALPGGSDSLYYASSRQKAISAQLQQYGQEDIVDFGIPRSKMDAMRTALAASPFAPVPRFQLEVSSMQLNKREMQTIGRRMEGMREAGTLSEETEYAMTNRQWQLWASNIQSMNTLTYNVADRLPAMASGRPSFMSRLDGPALASFNALRAGHPTWEFGANNGRGLKMQDDFIRDLVDPSMLSPRSRMYQLDGGGSDRDSDMFAAMLQELRNISKSLEGAGAGRSGAFRGEEIGKAAATLMGKREDLLGDFN